MADRTAEDHNRHIIVGVDGSQCSKTALRWAMDQARQTGADVEAVAAWQDPALYGAGFGYAWHPSALDGESATIDTQKSLDQAVSEVSGQMEHPVKVLTRVAEGHPADVLTTLAADAQMLVVGTRGHGSFARLLLGSVSQHCVQHAPCPVVVVPPETTHTPTQTPAADDTRSTS